MSHRKPPISIEHGLLTSSDAFDITFDHLIPLHERAHMGYILIASQCPACQALSRAINDWIAAHAVDDETLAELEAIAEEHRAGEP